jgi:cytochrome c oxidase cbb3-type subunit 3
MNTFRTASLVLTVLALSTYGANKEPIYAATAQAASAAPTDAGEKAYVAHCATCHGAHREGSLPTFPSLIGIKQQLKDQQIIDTIHHGKGLMPPFPNVQGEELTALVHFLGTESIAVSATPVATGGNQVHSNGTPDPGAQQFQQNCAFCHGRDAGGGESGPDLTRSKLVAADKNGDKISEVIHNGRPGKMPAFNLSDQETLSLVTFIHAQRAKAMAMKPGGRKGVDVSDLQTGNLEAGKAYFNGPGGCAKCHAVTGDLAGVASRHEGLELEMRMLYPRDAVSKAKVTLPSGESVDGTVAYQDEFVLGIRDAKGVYRSWPVGKIKFAIDSPVDAHAEQFSKYTDDDIHNLMAYIQTLK